jgi:hypothetical protein
MARNAEPPRTPSAVGLLEQPLPHQALVVALILVHVEPQK